MKNTNKNGNLVLGIDIGGTGIKAALVNIETGKLVIDRVRIKTPNPATPKKVLKVIDNIIKEFQWDGNIGCGFPGVIKSGVVKTAANLSKKWIGVNLSEELEQFTAGNCSVINDADAAGLAEVKFGPGKECKMCDGEVLLMITLGTGIGSALFIDGNLIPNTELGHIEVNEKDAEALAANSVREKKKLSWKKWGKKVNKYLTTLENLLSPDIIIIGGGVSKHSDKFFKYFYLQSKVKPASMGNNAGIIGAALSCLPNIN